MSGMTTPQAASSWASSVISEWNAGAVMPLST